MGDGAMNFTYLFILLMGFVLCVLWIVLPFAVFGIKDKLDRLIAEMVKSNALAEATLEAQRQQANSSQR